MKTIQEQQRATDAPQLSVFLGEEDNEVDNCRPADKNDQGYNDWVRIEAYWAGRNYAGRRSARIAA